ncbi:MAG: hypothetical protein N2258_07025 [Brevinematales bacterium]|nr:hypothetical protein [Brevinematales bacterium]
MKKLVFLIFLLLFSCSQEHLILIRNIKKIDFNLMEQILKDIGAISNKNNETNILSEDERIEQNLPVEKKIESENKIVRIKNNNIFTIKVPYKDGFVVLKSIEGDTIFNSNDTRIEDGIFSFISGKKDSKIRFELVNADGEVKKRLNYYINIIVETNVIQKVEEVSNKEKKVEVTNEVTNEKISALGIKGIIENIKNNLPYAEAVKEYENLINSDITEDEKDIVRYNLIELLIRRSNYEKAQKIINDIKNEGRKLYYNGLLNIARKRDKEGYIYYRDALAKSDNDTKKMVISGLLELLKRNKIATLDEVEDIEKNIMKFKNDKNFYANSMISLAEVYVYFEKVYKSEEILKGIIEGEYSEAIKKKARGVYKDLREGFIEYR